MLHYSNISSVTLADKNQRMRHIIYSTLYMKERVIETNEMRGIPVDTAHLKGFQHHPQKQKSPFKTAEFDSSTGRQLTVFYTADNFLFLSFSQLYVLTLIHFSSYFLFIAPALFSHYFEPSSPISLSHISHYIAMLTASHTFVFTNTFVLSTFLCACFTICHAAILLWVPIAKGFLQSPNFLAILRGLKRPKCPHTFFSL